LDWLKHSGNEYCEVGWAYDRTHQAFSRMSVLHPHQLLLSAGLQAQVCVHAGVCQRRSHISALARAAAGTGQEGSSRRQGCTQGRQQCEAGC
jgi:hypothetical protein